MIEIQLNLEFDDGNFQQGFTKLLLKIDSINSYLDIKPIEAQLSPAPEIPVCYQTWKNLYSYLTNSKRAFKDKPTNISISEHEQKLKQEQQERQRKAEEYRQQIELLRQSLNQWLEPVKSQLNALLPNLQQPNPEAEIHLVIHTHKIQSEADKNILHRLPWQEWNLFPQETTSEVALCLENSLSSTQNSPELLNWCQIRRVRIISILGNTDNGNNQKINTKIDESLIKDLKKKGAEIETLENPQRSDFIKLWEIPCDILFFAGHSHTEADGQVGKLYINKNDCLNLEELKRTLRAAIKNGLKIAIFNSCDGLGLAKQLADLNLPYIIVWREEVPDSIAQKFLDYFLRSFTEGKSLFTAVFEARCKLQELTDNATQLQEGLQEQLQEQLPGVSWLPVICQNTQALAPTWEELGGLTGELPDNPYQGLSAFSEKEAAFFFGRETVISDLVAAAKTKSLLPVIGASGSGKSSVVFAGLVPRLKEELENVAVIDFRPGNNPVENLAIALNKHCNKHFSQPGEEQAELEERTSILAAQVELEEQLHDDETKLCHFIENLINTSKYNRLLLVIDQFEELYTLTPENIRHSFLHALLLAVKCTPKFTLAFTIRADFYGYALSYRPFSDALQGLVYNLGPMNERELRNAIEQPAAKMKLELEEGLTSRIINDLGNQPGRLPLLEFALTQLWEKQKNWYLTHEAYQEIGGLNKALANHADKILEGKDEVEKFLIEQVFIQLVRPGEGTEDTKRVASEKEIGKEKWDLVQYLASERLVVTGKDETTQEKTVEIIHEALIREWKTLKDWIKKNRDFRIWQERLKPDVEEWLNKKDKNKKKDKLETLLQGTRLAVAQDWYNQRKDELSLDEQNFICESIKTRNKQQRQAKLRQIFTISGLAGGLAVVSLLAAISEIRRTGAELAQKSTKTEQLFVSDKYYDGLKEAIQVGRQLKDTFWGNWIAEDSKIQVVNSLRGKLDSEPLIKTFTSKGHSSTVNSVSFSQDGKIIATASYDGTLKLWDVASARVIQTFHGHSGTVNSVSFSPNGKFIASASQDKTVKLWDVTTGKVIKTLNGHSSDVNSVSFSSDGKVIASASWDETVKLWDAASGKVIKTLNGHSSVVNSISLSSDGKVMASASFDNTVKLWDVVTGKVIKTLNGHSKSVNSVSFSQDGKVIASASDDKTVKLWNVVTGEVIKTLNGHSEPVKSVSFSPDGKVIASASGDTSSVNEIESISKNKNTVKLWDAATGRVIKTLNGHLDSVNSVSFSPDGKVIASASDDKMLKLWDATSGKAIKALDVYSQNVRSVSFSKDGKVIATASFAFDSRIKLWNSTSNNSKAIKILDGYSKNVSRVSLSPDGKVIASASHHDKTVKLLDVASGKLIKTLNGHSEGVNSLNFSPNGKVIASASEDKTVKLWDVGSGKLIKTLNGYSSGLYTVSFSPDGKVIASASGESTVKLWDVGSGKLTKTFNGHSKRVTSVSFSPSSTVIASASEDSTVKLWDASTGKLIKTLNGHSKSVNSVSFSPDGKVIASVSDDNTVKLWDTATGKVIKTLRKRSSVLINVSFLPDNKTVRFVSNDVAVRLWDTNSGKVTMLVKGSSDSVTDASLSPDEKLIASASSDTTVKLWDNALNQQPKILEGHTEEVLNLSFSPNSKIIASASADTMVKIWDSITGKEIRTLKGHLNSVNSVRFSPDGNTIASASDDGTVKLWNPSTGKEIRTLRGHTGWVNSVSFSPNGKIIASVSDDSTVKLWNVATGQEIKINQGSLGSKPISVSFSPNGQIIALAMDNGAVKILSAETGREITTLKGHSKEIRSINFSPDSKILASASADGTVKLWDIASDKANWQVIITLTFKTDTYSDADTAVNSVRFSSNGKTIISAHDRGQFILWDFDLDNLLVRRCADLRTYIDNNLDNRQDESESLENKAETPVVDIKDKDFCKGIEGKPKR
ncbi:MAG: myosin kinase [Scytonematopsis contorta HA4267-MV1]|jgi:WD40 repeat protein|nr:myosin kinase [Scytonematopsis contorta HA4267-MV1]